MALACLLYGLVSKAETLPRCRIYNELSLFKVRARKFYASTVVAILRATQSGAEQTRGRETDRTPSFVVVESLSQLSQKSRSEINVRKK